jgi:hypothetical protein
MNFLPKVSANMLWDKRGAKLISSTEAIKDNLMFLKILFSPYAGHKILYSGGDALTEYG